jgi:uncharacterized protein (UPF0548 family)
VLLSRRADEAALERVLQRALQEPLSYPEVGASLGDRPPGYQHDDDSCPIGSRPGDFERAVEGLRRWQAHRGAGIGIHPDDAKISEGTTVVLALPFVGIYALAACRVVAIVDEPDRYGFAYGTLRSHPERGEEAFMVQRNGDHVTFRISAFSRPADALARVGAPLARRVQRQVTVGYLDGLARYVARAP